MTTLNGTDQEGDKERGSLVADGLQVDGGMFLDGGFTAAGTVTLRRARISNLVVARRGDDLPSLGEVAGWQIGDVLGAIRTGRKAAATWIGSQKTSQPWRELADVYDRNSQPSDARWLRYKSTVRTTRNTRPGPVKVGRWVGWITIGHGYYPLVAAAWLVVFYFLGAILALANQDTYTVPTTSTITEQLKTARTDQTKASEPHVPEVLPGRGACQLVH